MKNKQYNDIKSKGRYAKKKYKYSIIGIILLSLLQNKELIKNMPA